MVASTMAVVGRSRGEHGVVVVRDVEAYLLRVAGEECAPHPQECLLCYLVRAVDARGCDGGWSWARRFRELRSPLATGLEARLAGTGATCDCAVVERAYRPTRQHLVRDLHTDELQRPDRPPPCAGVGRLDSTRPCRVWERDRGGSPPAEQTATDPHDERRHHGEEEGAHEPRAT